MDSVKLEENPFVCDCRIHWLSKWLDETGTGNSASPQCMEPFEFQGQRVISLFNALKCPDGTTSNSLATESCAASKGWTCPSPCKCSEGIADCRNKKLTSIPAHFPEDTTEM